MQQRQVTNLARASLVAISLIATTLLFSASAQAATVQQKIYNIFTSEYHAELADSPAVMHSSLTVEQTKLSATASKIDALSSTNATAAEAMVDELESQYEETGLQPIFEASLKAYRALVKLPLTHTEHHDAVLDEAYLQHAVTINTAADLTSWTASGFTNASEPSHAKQFGLIIGITDPSIDLPISGSSAQVKAFTKLQDRAGARTTAAFNKVRSDWSSWIGGYGVASG